MKLVEIEDAYSGEVIVFNPATIEFMRAEGRKGRRKTTYIQLPHHYIYAYGSIRMLRKKLKV